MPRLKSLKCFIILLLTSVLTIFILNYAIWKERTIGGGSRSRLKIKSRYKIVTNEESALLNKAEETTNVYNEQTLLNLAQIRTNEDQIIHDEGYHQHAFNLLISNKLSYTRPLPDVRHQQCKEKVYPKSLPSVSVVICFHNEAYSALLRTVHSIYHRSPSGLIHEVILINDNSELDDLDSKLELYLKDNLPGAKLVKSVERLGLIRARMLGAKHATGQVLVFLDSHCEVSVGWLEPLVARIAEDEKNVVVPVIDMINSDTFYYEKSPLVKGGFNWGMHYRWDPLPATIKSQSDPIQSPTMAGGLFAINRQYFHHLGEYDAGMDIWGGENLEISFRIWQCGGRLEILPCSRVGHIFRKRRPYGSPVGDTFIKNSLRVAHTWMDEYKKYFFNIRPEAAKKPYGDISERLGLREKLKCKSFKWYLDHVYPEQSIPNGRNSQVVAHLPRKEIQIKRKGLLKHLGSGLCVDSSSDDIHVKKALLHLSVCNLSSDSKQQIWYETQEKDFRLANILCLDGQSEIKNYFARLTKCGGFGSQEWIWNTKGGNSQLFNPASGMCLTTNNVDPGSYLTLTVCSESRLLNFEVIPVS